MAVACAQPGCTGTILSDGYCDTCGALAPAPAPADVPAGQGAAGPSAAPSQPGPASTPALPGTVSGGAPWATGSIAADLAAGRGAGPGGAAAPARPTTAATAGATGPASPSARGSGRATLPAAVPSASARVTAASRGTGGPVSRRTASSRGSGATRARIGAGLVDVPPTPVGDPSGAIMSEAQVQAALGEVPEAERFCASCGKPVGRAAAGKAGRVKGFCGSCRTPFDFVTNAPALGAGDRVAGQYEIVGPLAHGGLGWIYLARDTAVSNRWVVLKGLLNSNDPDAVAAALAERQFLARMDHGNIVRIYNFVSHGGAGYIVMEYVGGQSLNAILKARRAANGGKPDPLPVAQAIAYVLATLPAIGYLHKQGLVYNDLKPANIMAVGEDVKLIDLGAVMRVDDASAAIFGTDGFQAPEVAQMGPSVASDIFTIGRTLAVLLLNFVYHDGEFRTTLPSPEREPLFATWESLHRLLLKATAEHPDDRFQSTDEMGEQLLGVLREIVALTEGQPRPAQSSSFGADLLAAEFGRAGALPGAGWRLAPNLRVDPTDPAAAFLLDLPPNDGSATTASLIVAALSQGQIADTTEARLRLGRAYLDAELGADAQAVLAQVEAVDPWDWRVEWNRGILALQRSDPTEAVDRFNRVWTDVPGELAPKLALALAAENAGQADLAAHLYDLVSRVDPAYTTAVFGLARCRLALADRAGAVAAYGRVPQTSAMYTEAQIATARALIHTGADAPPGPDELFQAAKVVEQLAIDGEQRAGLSREVLEAALGLIAQGAFAPQPGLVLLGRPLRETDLRLGLERSYRDLARLASSQAERDRLVDRANAVRPMTLV